MSSTDPARFYTADKLGRPCRHCLEAMPIKLELAGIYIHPTCGASS